MACAHAKITQRYIERSRAGCEYMAPIRSSVNGRLAVFTVSVSGQIGQQSHVAPRCWDWLHASTRVPSTPPPDSVLNELTALGVRPLVADRQLPCLSKAECRIRNHGVRELGAAAEQNCRKPWLARDLRHAASARGSLVEAGHDDIHAGQSTVVGRVVRRQ